MKKINATFSENSSTLSVSNVGKAMRNTAANGLDEELSRISANNQEMINAVDSTKNKGWTPLHWGVFKKRASCVQVLLNCGARYDIQDKSEKNQTAIDIFIVTNNPDNPEIAQMIVTHIQNKYVKTEDKNLEKVLRNVVNSRDLDLDAVKLLIHIGVNVNSASPSNGQTALHIAVLKKHTPIVILLLTHHADCDIQDKQGKRAIDYAENDESLLKIFSENKSINNQRSFT